MKIADFRLKWGFHYNWIMLRRWFRVKILRKCTMILSDSEDLYYIEEYCSPHSYWLSTKKYKTQSEAESKGKDWLTCGFSILNGKYFLVGYPFSFWKVNHYQRKQKLISVNSDEAKDYYSIEHNRRLSI